MNAPGDTSTEIWILDDDRSIRWVLEKSLHKAGLKTASFADGEEMLRRLRTAAPAVIVSDIRMPGMSGFELLAEIKSSHPGLPVIIMTAHSDLDSAVISYSRGAFEYLPKPFDIENTVAVVRRALEHSRARGDDAAAGIDGGGASREIIGEAPAMQEVFRIIGRLAQSSISVLINGESGTGKELVARALHRHSPRRERPFVPLNVAAIPGELIESELFGHEKGAFTGAGQRRTGRFEQADGGTLFLDEIGDMPPDTQTRLLRVLSEGEFHRVGGHVPIRVDVRIIAATHQNLEQLSAGHRFREDLFHRLNVIRIQVPKLRERREDIPALARHFLGLAAAELDAPAKALRPETERYLQGLDWPGNVRQLENFCRWITVMSSGREIHLSDLPADFTPRRAEPGGGDWLQALERWADERLKRGDTGILEQAMPSFERAMIHVALKHTAGRKRDAAVLLGWGRNTLTRKMRELETER